MESWVVPPVSNCTYTLPKTPFERQHMRAWQKISKFPGFGKEVFREHDVREQCYDCVRFIKGCQGKKVSTGKFSCDKIKVYRNINAG